MRPAPLLTARAQQARRTQSFLVRMWSESHEAAGDAAAVRAYVRDLQTGEESYAKDPDELAAYLGRQVSGAGQDEGTDPVRRNGERGTVTSD